MTQLAAKDFQQVYDWLGIDTGKLGCIMLDTDFIIVSDVIPEEDLYYADPAKHKRIQGVVSEEVPHVTLLYGLLHSGQELAPHVDVVLEGWQPEDLKIEEIGFFYSNYPGENYITIVALIEVTDNLAEANARLKFLPHIDTFTDYKPHITLAYVKDSSDYNSHIKALNATYKGQSVKALALNYDD